MVTNPSHRRRSGFIAAAIWKDIPQSQDICLMEAPRRALAGGEKENGEETMQTSDIAHVEHNVSSRHVNESNEPLSPCQIADCLFFPLV